ncbi:MAG: hypothetical protein LBI03_03750 [Clostridiales bacterium]|jgi:hypothetical protein|nr:hypothetical protein [Clostridiales bacterium]
MGVTTGEESNFPKGVYETDFEKQIVLLSDKSRAELNQIFIQPSDEYYKPEEYGASVEKYREKRDANPLLPQLYDWSTVTQIDDDTFYMILPDHSENTSPGVGYYYFKIVILTHPKIKSYKIIEPHWLNRNSPYNVIKFCILNRKKVEQH